MAEDNKKKPSTKRISDEQRYKYVGFDVHPGQIKNQFKSDAERKELIDRVREKRGHKSDLGALRDDCMLLEPRVSMADRIVLAVACVVMIAALFLPWYAVYNQEIEESQVEEVAEVVDDSLLTDSTALATTEDGGAVDESGTAEGAVEQAEETALDDGYSDAPKEEVLHGYVAKKKIIKTYSRLSGLGSLAVLGSVGGYVFSSGFVLVLTGVMFLIMTLASLLLPAYTLYGLFGLKGTADQQALKLKSILRYNWVPTLVFVAALSVSFIGGDYSFDAASLYHSLGDSYGPGAFMGSLSWGVFVSLGASIMLAVKGIEI